MTSLPPRPPDRHGAAHLSLVRSTDGLEPSPLGWHRFPYLPDPPAAWFLGRAELEHLATNVDAVRSWWLAEVPSPLSPVPSPRQRQLNTDAEAPATTTTTRTRTTQARGCLGVCVALWGRGDGTGLPPAPGAEVPPAGAAGGAVDSPPADPSARS